MKRIFVCLVIALTLMAVYEWLYRPADEAAAAGSAAYRAGDYARAEARFRQAEQGASDPGRAAYNHAAALYRLRRFEDADRTYERSADGDGLRAARAVYDRGNCAFGEACAEDGTADPALLERAAVQYEACLAREGSTPAAGSLFDDARHNLELTRLILAEMAAESGEATAGKEPSDPEDPANADNDPFAPANAAHPPGSDGQQKPADARAQADPKAKPDPKGEEQQPAGARAKGDPKGQEQKPADAHAKADPKQQQTPAEAQAKDDSNGQQKRPSDAQAKADSKEQQTKECKECSKGGCPKCKKKPKGPGGELASRKGDGPKPNPGNSDNGKSPGKGKSPSEAHHPDPGGKGKPGEGGKPKPDGKNGVGDAKEPGTGEADEAARTGKKSPPGEGQKVGPDGVSYKPQDKPSQGGEAGEGDGPADAAKQPPRPGGKNGSPLGAPGDADKPRDGKDHPPPPPSAEVDKLFKPGTPPPIDRNDRGSGGGGTGQGRAGSGRYGIAPDTDETDGTGDPVERAATRRLRQAIQRIQGARDSRQPPPGSGKGEVPGPDRRRDW